MQEFSHESLLDKINNKKAQIAVIGLGYVGLLTAAHFADLGFSVVGVDIKPNIIKTINQGTLQAKEVGLSPLVNKLKKSGRLKATGIAGAIAKVDIIVECVQTPVNKKGKANLSFIEASCQSIARFVKNKLVVLQSTIPPKTVDNLVLPILEQTGLECGSDFWLVYCPERLSPGSGLQDLGTNSRLLGSKDQRSAVLGKALFQIATKGKLTMTDIRSAEVSKIAENAFRYVNIAFANELALICKEIDADATEVIRLANTHPRVNIHQPGCGAGGPCLSKDTHILLNSVSELTPNVLISAISLNRNMPKRIAEFAVNSLNMVGKNVGESKIAVFGTAYKGDVDDSRSSPSEGIIEALKRRHVKIVVYDPICHDSFGQCKAKNLIEAVKDVDCIIVATDHKEFSQLNLQQIKQLMKEKPIIVDGKKIINPVYAKNNGFEYISISYKAEVSKKPELAQIIKIMRR